MKLKNGLYSIESDTCVNVIEHSDRDQVIDRYGDNEESHFLSEIKKSGVEYEVIDPAGPGGDWPVIEYTGTKEQLCHILEFLNPCGYTKEELTEMLEDWDGDEDELWDIIG